MSKDQVEARRVDLGGGVSMFMLAAGVRAEGKRPRAESGKSRHKHKLNGANGKTPPGIQIKDS